MHDLKVTTKIFYLISYYFAFWFQIYVKLFLINICGVENVFFVIKISPLNWKTVSYRFIYKANKTVYWSSKESVMTPTEYRNTFSSIPYEIMFPIIHNWNGKLLNVILDWFYIHGTWIMKTETCLGNLVVFCCFPKFWNN